ncbi:MAG: SUMF1/EgtB/PvdO family nonheme iron enzyme [Planctomycetes bacterium]|nr:SUMF1/EgtB/PvdO family nonheme iron enzyme [Planctomycetota bacterium]
MIEETEHEDPRYDAFVERYLETGARDVPEDWPRDLRKRCLFFLRMMEAEASGPGAKPNVALLESSSALTIPEPAAAAGPEPARPREDEDRYVVEGEIARGGMGRVLLAYDRDFRRKIAMKVMLGDERDPARASRFVQEAQTTAQLEHPNIAPVYDIGLDEDGPPFFTMKWIHGRNLAEVLRSGGDEYSLTRLVQVLQQAAMAVHFAHTKGVIHRDLKPQNVMLGDFGEVLVVDWGLAKVSRAEVGSSDSGAAISTSRSDGGERTLDGSVQGSAPYMAPEQARGEVAAIDQRTDVFGLGAILYEVLTGQPPYAAESPRAVLAKARRGEIIPPSERAPGRAVPRILEQICLKALSPRREDRYRDAGELHQALQEYLEGIHSAEQQAAEANRLLWVAEKLHEELRAAEKREAELRAEEASLRPSVKSYDPEERKKRLWELSEEHGVAREAAARELTRTAAAYLAVLSIAPGHRQARSRLAEVYHHRLAAAEERGDREAAATYRSFVEQYDDGQYAAELSGEGLLRLESSPAGATVLLCRFEERGLLLREGGWETIGTTPLERALPRGSYLAVLWKEGCAETRWPFVIDPRRPCSGRVRLVPARDIPEGFVQVPGGLTLVGTDSRSFLGLERRLVDVGEIFVGRFPVTFGEYCAFLNERCPGAEDPPEELRAAFGREQYVLRGPEGFAPVSHLDPRMPVLAVTRAAALAYAAWLGQKVGKRVRLLREEEWERCARGADGRLYPWGNGFDWTFSKGALSRPGEPFPEPVGAFPRDVSVFGIRDLAGTVRELCDGWANEGYRPVRGGSWFSPFPSAFRADTRTVQRDANRSTDAGFRVCYDEEAPGRGG